MVIARPSYVDWDEPSIKSTDSPLAGRHEFDSSDEWRGEPSFERIAALEENASLINNIFDEGWVRRLNRLGLKNQPSHAGGPTCHWRYQNLTIDLALRVMPCCAPPSKKAPFGFWYFRIEDSDLTNSRDHISSRLLFADRPEFDLTTRRQETVSYCANCPNLHLICTARARLKSH